MFLTSLFTKHRNPDRLESTYPSTFLPQPPPHSRAQRILAGRPRLYLVFNVLEARVGVDSNSGYERGELDSSEQTLFNHLPFDTFGVVHFITRCHGKFKLQTVKTCAGSETSFQLERVNNLVPG